MGTGWVWCHSSQVNAGQRRMHMCVAAHLRLCRPPPSVPGPWPHACGDCGAGRRPQSCFVLLPCVSWRGPSRLAPFSPSPPASPPASQPQLLGMGSPKAGTQKKVFALWGKSFATSRKEQHANDVVLTDTGMGWDGMPHGMPQHSPSLFHAV